MDGLYSTLVPGVPEGSVETLGISSVGGRVHLPAGEDFLRADFARSGPDLLIETPGGGHYVVPGYFMAEVIPFLETVDGAVLSPKLVSALAGPQVVGMVAQAAQPGQAALQSSGLGEPIGQVSEAEGGVDVRHVDGSQSTLSVGDPIFQGDVLETAQASHVGIVFVDDTIFSLDESGRMVVDEMVFDPDAQTGIFNAQVVQGVFSFVSGQVAKTSPDGMVISTPTNTIGIRGTTGAGRAGGEGTPNRISLLPDPDGNVGEMVVTNGAGFQVLNKAGASLTVFSFDAPMAPPVILSSAQIQQSFGTVLTKLTLVVAQKATMDANRAAQKAQKSEEEAKQAETEAKQAQEDAQQAEEGAQQADAEAEAAQAEAEAALAEAEAAKAEAEANGDAEALAKAEAAEAKAMEAQAKAQEAQVKAQAEVAKAAQVKAAAEAKAAEFATKQAEAFQFQAQAQKAAEFTVVAKAAADVQTKVFQEFVQSGVITLPPGVSAADVMSAGQKFGAFQAGQAGLADTVQGPGPGPGDGPNDGFQGPGPQAGFQQGPGGIQGIGFNPFAPGPYGGGVVDAFAKPFSDPFTAQFADPFTAQFAVSFVEASFGGPSVNPYGGGMVDPYGGYMDPFAVGFDLLMGGSLDLFDFFDVTDLYNFFAAYDPFNVINYYYDDYNQPLTTVFDETLIAGSNGGTLRGTSVGTNFYFQWRDGTDTRWINGNYTVTDAGGINQLSLDNLDDVTLRVVMTTGTGGVAKLWQGGLGGAGDIDIVNDPADATITFSSISQFLLSDVSVASFATIDFATSEDKGGDVMVLSALGAEEVGYVIAGTDADDTFIIDQTFDGAIIFGKGNDDNMGGDYFYFESLDAYELTAIGGITNTDNVDSDSDGIPDTYLNRFDYTNIGYTAGSDGILAQLGGSSYNDVNVTDLATQSVFFHELWDVSVFIASAGDDELYVTSGNYYSIQGEDGDDTITVSYGARFYELLGGVGTDTITVNASALEYNRVINDLVYIDGGGDVGDDLTINATYASTYCLNDPNGNYMPVNNFDTVAFNAASATGAVTVYSEYGIVTFIGSSFGDTFQVSADDNTLTGGSGADVYRYMGYSGFGDTITDFVTGTDSFEFAASAFGNLTPAALSSTNFFSGAGATEGGTADHLFVYDSTNRILYYDADGVGGGAGEEIVSLTSGTINLADISIYDDSGGGIPA